ncbi:hypothetical protein ACWDQL_34200, partial [Streptomyces olivaceus]
MKHAKEKQVSRQANQPATPTTKLTPIQENNSKKAAPAAQNKPPNKQPGFFVRKIKTPNQGPRQRPGINHNEFAARRILRREIPPGISLGAFMPLRP